jgi:bifunctional non-homologous end joining protein LigD
VVQRHRARRLHYDLRLEMGGVLASWSVPKGPTLDPSVRRLAVHVEDHPLDYFDFEGVIPPGEYGGGDVIVWDWGTWTLADGDDPVAAVDRGELHFDLHGEKLAGRFVLVRRSGKRRGSGGGEWLLLHKADDFAEDGWDPEDHPTSVKTGRTNDEVEAAPAASWSSTGSWAGANDDELAALDALPDRGGRWTVGDHEIRVSSLDRTYMPATDGHPAITKRDLLRYYTTVAPALLPYLAGRPVNMHRYPSGITESGFWQKAAPSHTPEWIRQWENPSADPGETRSYLVLESGAALAFVVNYGALELHPWTSTAEHPQQPSWALIDIDPGTASTFEECVELAVLYRTALDHLGVEGMPKVTGKRGIQIWVPVASGYTFDDTRTWVETVSRAIGATLPDLVSWEWETAKRGGRTRLDYTQSAINKTLVAPFSVRPSPGAPVSVPISWDELDDPDLTPDRWTVHDVEARLATTGDPLAPLVGRQQRLPKL